MSWLRWLWSTLGSRIRLESIRSKFILSFIVLSVIPMFLVAYFSYQAYLDILQSNIQAYSSEVIDRVDRNLDIYINDLERILDLRNDYYSVQFIKLCLAGDIEGNRKYTYRLWENLDYLKKLKIDLRNISIITLDGVTISCYGVAHTDLSQHELFQTLVNRTSGEDNLAIWGPHRDWLGGMVFSIGKAIRGDYDNFLGIMSIDIDVGLLDRICKNIRLGKSGYVMLVDDEGRIVYHPKPELSGKSLSFLITKPVFNDWKKGFPLNKRSNNQVITTKTFAAANWKIVGLSNKLELAEEMQKITGIALLLILATIVVLTMAAVFMAGLLTKPIKELQWSMWRASEDLNTNVTVHSNDEIGQLGKSFNQMLARIRQLMEQSVQEQKLLRRAEMIALQEQIKPHFVYNTLDLIIGLLETKKNEDVINTVEALGSFFRISLSNGKELITIREETEHVRNYLYIQRMRHGDKYDFLLEIDESLLNQKIIKLILQPLVENAIYHGVRELENCEGLIVIKGFLIETAQQICLQVIDNGVGMEGAKLAEINQCLLKSGTEQRCFGLTNVNERIRLAFGQEYGLELSLNAGGGVTATVRLPMV